MNAKHQSAASDHRSQAWIMPPGAGVTSVDLPSEMVERGQKRLSFACLCYALVYLAAWQGIYWLLKLTGLIEGDHRNDQFNIQDALGWLAITGSLALAYFTRRVQLSQRVLERLGTAFEILAGLGIAVVIFGQDWPEDGIPVGLTWVTLWIAVFPGIYIASPRYLLIGSLGTAMVTPSVTVMYGAVGYNMPPTWTLVAFTASDLIAAFMAVGTGRLMYRMGAEVKQAR